MAKTLICTKSGVSADSTKSAKSAENRTSCVKKCAFFYAKSAVSALLALFLESAETPLFVHIFAAWTLRLDRKYTTATIPWTCPVCPVKMSRRSPADILSNSPPKPVPGTLPRHTDHQTALCVLALSAFFSLTSQPVTRRVGLALFKSPSGGGLTKMGSVTFWNPLDTSFLFAQIVGARWPQKASVFGLQNLALCEVLGSKCNKNNCGKHSGKFVKLVFARYLPFVAETSKQC